MEPSHTACLDIRLSTAPGTLWRNAPLTDDVTHVGRPEAGEPGVNLEYLWVSRKHARIFCEGIGEDTTYFLENWNGPAGIRNVLHCITSHSHCRHANLRKKLCI